MIKFISIDNKYIFLRYDYSTKSKLLIFYLYVWKIYFCLKILVGKIQIKFQLFILKLLKKKL